MSVKIVSLSRGKESGKSTIEATFMRDGNIVPLKVSEEAQPSVYAEINKMLETPNLNVVEVATDLFNLMSPEAKVQESIKSSYFLSGNLSIRNGKIYFGEERLEDTLANHMLSLLDNEKAPKDEKMWRSYVKFLDNMYQNVNPEIREQLFRWMNYENKSGNAFAITDDGCIVGYKGCQGTILEPMSKFTGYAIVDGEEYNGHIPNKVGSVVQMPRSSVTHDPSVGCSQGLHVGTRDYATSWAPILLLVKVNPRDVVSVPFECDSQKMRVCEYTVLQVTDASDEHRMYYASNTDSAGSSEQMSPEEAYDVLGEVIYVEAETGEDFTGQVTDVFEDGEVFIQLTDEDGEEFEVALSEITHWEYACDEDLEDDEDFEFEEDEDLEDEDDLDEIASFMYEMEDKGSEVYISYDGGDREFVGTISEVYEAPGKDSGVILRNGDTGEVKHIKFYRINDFSEVVEVEGEDLCEMCEADGRCAIENSPYKEILTVNQGTTLVIAYTCDKTSELKAIAGQVIEVDGCNMEITLIDNNNKQTTIGFESIVSLQAK